MIAWFMSWYDIKFGGLEPGASGSNRPPKRMNVFREVLPAVLAGIAIIFAVVFLIAIAFPGV